ncbi:hypothetical protein WICPIJ_003809 [Wickerhamomyces pijperi]|uniref:mRNA export factor MEX67 n=1 Tax=Wickerhamomyces pijperi TaxID=599730 RepID=A0A9P8Q8X1_WICPI|nr:hypothetical protein WICPIJ_003809 [Wickerhamomyces pijperi]
MSYRGRNNHNNYNNNRGQNNFNNPNNVGQMAQQNLQANAVPVEVRGWTGATKEELLTFLSRKTRISIVNSAQEGDVVLVQLRNQSDANDLIKWSGVKFAGQSLRITQKHEPSAGATNTMGVLKHFLSRRYDPASKMLNLSMIASDPELQQLGTLTISTQSKMFPALMKLAADEPSLIVETVDLSNNNLEDLAGITMLSQSFPNLLNLSLANNRISKVRSLDLWKNKFKKLRELILANNPISSDPAYRDEVCKNFPKLIMLDGHVVRDEALINKIFKLPLNAKQFFFEDNEIQTLSSQFIQHFLPLWDTDRSQLMSLYSPDSQFSLCADSSIPSDEEVQSSFGYYIPISRNLTRVSSERTRATRVGKGPEQIYKLFQNIPKTKHPLAESPQLFSMESWRIHQISGFMISLHGSFQEVGSPAIDPNKSSGPKRSSINSSSTKLSDKSFDRLFTIVPGPNGGFIIASDLLSIRPKSNAESWDESKSQAGSTPSNGANANANTTPAPGTPATAAAGATPSSAGNPTVQPPSSAGQFTNEQQLFLQKLSIQTKLNEQYTVMLAQQSNWNYEQSLSIFTEFNATGAIPKDAFRS